MLPVRPVVLVGHVRAQRRMTIQDIRSPVKEERVLTIGDSLFIRPRANNPCCVDGAFLDS
jgi:hypothetical protein